MGRENPYRNGVLRGKSFPEKGSENTTALTAKNSLAPGQFGGFERSLDLDSQPTPGLPRSLADQLTHQTN